MRHLSPALYHFFASLSFFRLILGYTLLSALWIALTARYPMAFDEDFHLGIIRLYAEHPLPFWASHPVGGDAFGAVARDPSYLFHYVMSFPYQLFGLFTDNETVKILLLRLMNIAFFLSCLPLFRRVFQTAGASAALTNGCLALFVLIPIVPMMAGQINYDNVLLPITALLLLQTLRLRAAAVERRLALFLQILVLGLLGSLIKFAFLPIFVAVFIWILFSFRRDWGIRQQYAAASRSLVRTVTGGLLIGSLLVLSGLAVERYGVNLVRYGDPIPSCGAVLPIDNCQYYGPYYRDYLLTQNKTNFDTNPISFTQEWFYGMWLRTFFAVDGPTSKFQTRGPLLSPALSAIVFIAIGALASLIAGRALWRRQPAATSLFSLVGLTYIAAVWVQQYQLYSQTGVPVALNGRYLLLVILPIMFLLAMSVSLLLRHKRTAKTSLLTLALLTALWGGGVLTYILRSNDAWYWNNNAVRQVNHAVQDTVGPLVPGYDDPTAFLR